MSYLSLHKLTKRYGPGVGAFDIDLVVEKGEALCLLGASGCGKTTLLRMIAGLIAPDAGTVSIGGENVTASPTHGRDIGMVFQTWALFPHLSVRKNVEFGLVMRGVAARERRDRVERMLDLVGLSALIDRRPHQLSGGQQQRVALARALVINPRVLLLDEPMSSLDFNTRVELRREIRQLQQKLEVTAVYVTHDYSEALAVADRTVLMRAGEIVEIGRTRELFERPGTKFGARFLGLHNLIPGRIVDGGGTGPAVELISGHRGVTGAPPAAATPRGDGEVVLVGFDEWSTGVAFAPVDTGAPVIPVTVVSTAAEHGYTRLTVAIDGLADPVRGRLPGFHEVAPGAQAFLDLDWSKAWVVRDI